MEAFFVLLIIVVIAFALVGNKLSNSKNIQELKRVYEESLKGDNKKIALDAGRAYYSALRDKKVLTVYDEQAITNDLTAMDNNRILETK